MRCAPALDAILDAVEACSGRTRIRRRSGSGPDVATSRFRVPSPEIERLVGERIIERRGWKVDLSDPALVVYVEVVKGVAFCVAAREAGPGGLPTGSSGSIVCLLSGGIDSPVAAWRMMRRGCRLHAVHFHSQPLTSAASQETVRR